MEKIGIPDKKNRVGLLDEIRGFAIIGVVMYHAAYLLINLFNVNIPFFNSTWLETTRDIFAGSFIFISGTMCRYSRNNLKRGVICFFCGMLITFVTAFFPIVPILFGILHFLGISMMIYGLCGEIFERLPAWAGLPLCAVLAALTWNISRGFVGIPKLFELNLPKTVYNVGLLFPFGMYNSSFASSDYYPIIPWLFVFLGGSYFAEWLKEGSLPDFFYSTHIKWLAAIGRHTMWIYLLHVPIIYIILTLTFHFLH